VLPEAGGLVVSVGAVEGDAEGEGLAVAEGAAVGLGSIHHAYSRAPQLVHILMGQPGSI